MILDGWLTQISEGHTSLKSLVGTAVALSSSR